MDIERKRIKTNREISNIIRELMMIKNSFDIKILSERVMVIKVYYVTSRFGRIFGCFYLCLKIFFEVFKILIYYEYFFSFNKLCNIFYIYFNYLYGYY